MVESPFCLYPGAMFFHSPFLFGYESHGAYLRSQKGDEMNHINHKKGEQINYGKYEESG